MEQRLVQSPQMIQAMQILQLPSLELEERVAQELTENPFLEVVEPDAREAEDAARKESSEEATPYENMLEVLERYEKDFGDGGRGRPQYSEEGDRKLEAMNNTPQPGKTLAEALLEQLAFLEFDERGRELADYIIYSLDHRGFLRDSLEEMAESCDTPDVTADELAEVRSEIRRISHPAIGAVDLSECLLLQLDALGLEAPLVRTLIRDHLGDITTNRLPRIAKTTGRTIEEVKQAIEIVRTLEPNPGSEYGEEQAAAIMPDVMVEEIDGAYEIRLTRTRVPDLTINPLYRQMLRQARRGDGAHEWIKKRIESARWFMDAILQRQTTLQRIAEAIFVRQRGFLDRGVRALQPLRMQEIADEVGVHISTVSRAVSGKYSQTPRGTYPLKFFFTGGTEKGTGGVASQASIKQRIAEFIENEDAEKPLSDDQLAALLAEKDQIKIARRTVTKYRKSLEIPSSNQRRRF